MTPDAPFLSVRKLAYHALNGQQLLQDISFDLQEGSVLAIAGPNGAGNHPYEHAGRYRAHCHGRS